MVNELEVQILAQEFMRHIYYREKHFVSAEAFCLIN